MSENTVNGYILPLKICIYQTTSIIALALIKRLQEENPKENKREALSLCQLVKTYGKELQQMQRTFLKDIDERLKNTLLQSTDRQELLEIKKEIRLEISETEKMLDQRDKLYSEVWRNE